MPANTFDEILKFNPYHDEKGRFAPADRAASFTYAPGKSKAHDLAIAREKERQAGAAGSGGSAEVHSPKPGKITYESEDFGKPGTYVVYRNGAIGTSGMLFFAPKKETADTYASNHGDGNTSEYEVTVKNPLVVRGAGDGNCLYQAYNTLHPGAPMKGELTSSKWMKADKANAAKIGPGKEYDAIIYIVNGKPKEFQIPAKSASTLKRTGEYTTTKWSRTGWTMEEAKAKGYYDWEPQDYQKVVTKSAPESDEFSIFKTDDDKRLVFGWASVSINLDGEQLEDRQRDMIDPEDLEEAAYEYVLNFRDTGEEHIPTMRKKGKLVESCVFTEEKQKAMGIPPGTVPVAWWIGFKIEDDDAWERVKNGTYRMFSIEGKANREPVEKSVETVETSAKTFDDILKHNDNHDPATGRFAPKGGGVSNDWNVPAGKTAEIMQKVDELPEATGDRYYQGSVCANPIPYEDGKASFDIMEDVFSVEDGGEDPWDDNHSTWETVDISSLTTRQNFLYRDNLKSILGDETKEAVNQLQGPDDIRVATKNGVNLLFGGNHRCAISKLAGEKTVRARVFHCDET